MSDLQREQKEDCFKFSARSKENRPIIWILYTCFFQHYIQQLEYYFCITAYKEP